MRQKVTAHQKFIRQSPRKLRLVADLVRNMPYKDALVQLQVAQKRAAAPIEKALKQANANAVNNLKLDPKSIKIDVIDIQEGPVYKRWRPVSRGRAHSILKRSSHIKVVVSGETQKGV